MKKYITSFALLFVCSFILIACGDDSSETANGQEDSVNETQQDDAEKTNEEENNEVEEPVEDTEVHTDDESEPDSSTNIIDTNIDTIYQTITENDLLNEEALDMATANLDWEVTELSNFSNKTITYHENKAFFTYYGDTYALRLEDNSFSEKIDTVSDAQIVPYQEQLVFLQKNQNELLLHYLDPAAEEVVNTVENELKSDTDSISNTYMHEDKLIGVTSYVGNIYIFDLASNTLEKVINTEDILGEKRDYHALGFKDGLLYIGIEGIGSSLFAIDVDSEEMVWELKLDENSITANVQSYPKEAIFIEDSMYVLLEEKAYLEINKDNGEVINGADFGITTHLLHVNEENIYLTQKIAHRKDVEDKQYILSLRKDNLEPDWAAVIDTDITDFSAAVHDNYLYTIARDPDLNSTGTKWYKLDIDTGDVLAKDTIEELTNQNAEGLFFGIDTGKMLIADGNTLAITALE